MSGRSEKWTSNLGAVLAFMGATVGLGSLWRFPYKVGVFGGAAFLLAYFVCYFLVGIPAYIGETILGKATGKNPAGAMKEVAKKKGSSTKWRLVGDLTVVLGTILNAQYLVVVGWTVVYVYLYATGAVYGDAQAVFDAVFPGWASAIGLVVAAAICFYVTARGIVKGIELANKIAMPLLFAILVVCAVRALTLPGAWAGVEFLFYPEVEKLLDPETWFQALGQVYFTMALGIGFIITYGKYLRKEQSVVSNTYQVALGDNLASILAGLAIFPAVFAFGLHAAAGPQLVFVTLPSVFEHIPLGHVFGLMFSIGLALAALQCTQAAFEVATSYLMEEYGVERKKAALAVTLFQIAVGLLPALSGFWFDIFDIGWTLIPPITGLLTVVFVSWIWRAEEVRELISSEGRTVGSWWVLSMKYVVPAGILLVLAYYAVNLLA